MQALAGASTARSLRCGLLSSGSPSGRGESGGGGEPPLNARPALAGSALVPTACSAPRTALPPPAVGSASLPKSNACSGRPVGGGGRRSPPLPPVPQPTSNCPPGQALSSLPLHPVVQQAVAAACTWCARRRAQTASRASRGASAPASCRATALAQTCRPPCPATMTCGSCTRSCCSR